MKKNVLLLAAVLVVTCAANSFAAFAWIATTSGQTVIPVTGTHPALNLKPSANVVIGYDTVAATGITYTLGTFHTTGTKSFGTTSTDTNIYYLDNAAGGIANTITTATKPPAARLPTNPGSGIPGAASRCGQCCATRRNDRCRRRGWRRMPSGGDCRWRE